MRVFAFPSVYISERPLIPPKGVIPIDIGANCYRRFLDGDDEAFVEIIRHYKSAFTDGSTALVLLQITAPEHLNLDLNDIYFDIGFRGIIRGDNPSKDLGGGDSRIKNGVFGFVKGSVEADHQRPQSLYSSDIPAAPE